MGFDIECIIDLQSYPGEFFCPVCRTLVYPNEALQAQCTHVYCKPCLAHIANGTRACPYDGYLVTESDSKQLMESDKPLAEKIGKVKVHCLFFRSGCTWEGTLSESASHGSVCSFGNSPVICNRCGIQIVHRQVHEHAQVCPGVYDGQLAAGLTKSGTNSSTVPAVVSQTGAPVSQAQIPQNVGATPFPVQNPNVQTSHAPVAPVALTGPEQWYQHQYQQYYQQYVGYDPYQQHQQYYSLQQQPSQQYQQHQVQVQGQQQSHVYSQAPAQVQAQPQAPQQAQPPAQPQAQPPAQPQAQQLQQTHVVHQGPPQPPQMQAQGQAQTQLLPQGQHHMQLTPQGQAPNYQVNPHQPLHPAMRPQSQQVLPLPPPPPNQSTQPSQHPQAIGVRPPAPHQQYQQPMHHSQPSMQPQMHPQTQPYSQSSNVQIQPQSHHSQPPIFHHQASANLPPVSGNQSYQQPQPAQNMQSGAMQQHPNQVHGQVPQQPALMQQSQSQQPSTPLPPPNQQFLPHGQQLTYPLQQLRPPMQPVQPSNYAQQQQSYAPYQGQMHQQGHLPPLQSQMQMRALGPPQSQNYTGMPNMPNQGIHSQSHPFSSAGFGPLAPSGPAQPGSTQTPAQPTAQDNRSPSKRPAEKSFEGESLKEDARAGQNETAVKDANNAAQDGSSNNQEALEQSFGGKSSEAGIAEGEFRKEAHSLTDSANYDRQSISALPPSSTEGHMLPKKSHGSHSERSPAQVERQPSSVVGPQGPMDVPHHVQSHKLAEGKSLYNPYAARVDSKIVTAPQFGEGYYGPQHVVRPNEVAVPRDRMVGSGEGGPLVKPHADEPSFFRANGGPAPDSKFGPRDENMRPFFPRKPTLPLEQGSRSLDKPFHGPMYDAGSKLDPGDFGSHSGFLPHRPSGGHIHRDAMRAGPEFGQHHIKPFAYQSSGGDYPSSPPRRFGGPPSFTHGSSSLDDFNSREPHRFGDGSMSSNLPSDLVGNSFRDGRFPPLPRRGDIDGPMNPRFGEHMPPPVNHNQIGSDDAFWADGPGHLTRGKPSGPKYMPGHFNMGETAGNFPRPPFPEPVGGDVSGFMPYGDPTMRNNYPFHGYPNAGNFSGGMDSIDRFRNRKLLSTGWCRICEYDCETVEGLEMHSQTREHQNRAMDIVKSIKLKNKKKHRSSAGRTAHEGGRSRKMGSAGRGKRQ